MAIDTNKNYTATFNTSRGEIVCELFAKDAPKTVNNFVFLAREKFYDGTVFHRVIGDFMIQGGDPTGHRHAAARAINSRTRSRAIRTSTRSAACRWRMPGRNTNGSQFFITHVVTQWLDGKHTVFGQVTKGQDVVNAIKQGDTLKGVTVTES